MAAEVDGVAVVGDATVRADAERLFAEAPGTLAGKGASALRGIVDIVGMARYRDLLDMDDETWDWHHDIVLRHAYLAVSVGGPGAARRRRGRHGVRGVGVGPHRRAPPRRLRRGQGRADRPGALGRGGDAARSGSVSTPWRRASCGPDACRGTSASRGGPPTPRIRRSDRVAYPRDIAAAIAFLASDLSSYVNGQVLSVDGGVGVKFPYGVPEHL